MAQCGAGLVFLGSAWPVILARAADLKRTSLKTRHAARGNRCTARGLRIAECGKFEASLFKAVGNAFADKLLDEIAAAQTRIIAVKSFDSQLASTASSTRR